MVILRVFWSLLIVVAGTAHVWAQEPDLSWLKSYSAVPNETLHARADNYALSELNRFQKLLEVLKATPEASEWDGFYVAGGPDSVGISSLRIRLGKGFASLYVYTCTPELREIDYGTVRETEDTVELVRDIPDGSPRKSATMKFVKVRWADRRFLVAERSLRAFAEKAVGLFVLPYDGAGDFDDWWDFWETGDFDQTLTGKPQFPAKYRHLEKSAVEAKILSVQPRSIVKEFSTPRTYHGGESAIYKVTVSAGTKQGLKKGVALKIDGTSEELVITSVGKTTSQGVIIRAINESSSADHCLTDEAMVIPCPKFAKGMKVSTEVGNLIL